MPTIRAVIDTVNAFETNTFTDAQKLAWLNEVEQSVKEEIMRTYLLTTICKVSGVAEYSLPNGVVFEDIDTVYFDGNEVSKLDQRSFLDGTVGEIGYYKPTTASKIALNPTPNSDDDVTAPSVRVIYLDKFTAYTDTGSYGTSMLITKPQHLKVYYFYLLAQIALFRKEYENYNNLIIQYNSVWKDFSNFYLSKQPVDKSAVFKNLW